MYDIILYFILEILFLGSIASIHEFIYKISIHFKFPTIVSDIIIICVYILIVVVSILDVENSREMQNDIS